MLYFISSAFAKPNFTGTWVRDARNSSPFTAVLVPLLGSGQNQPGNIFILRVNHVGKHLQVAVEQDGQTPQVTNYDLGRGWHGLISRDFGGTTYKTEWSEDALILTKYANYHGNYRDMRGDLEQHWVLSPAGDTLTITSTMNRIDVKEVFRKK